MPGAQFLDANFFSHARIRDAQVWKLEGLSCQLSYKFWMVLVSQP